MSTVRIYEVEKKGAIQKKGFTILEVLISLSILVLTLMHFISHFPLQFLSSLQQIIYGKPFLLLRMNC